MFFKEIGGNFTPNFWSTSNPERENFFEKAESINSVAESEAQLWLY